jgi:LuxR family maltose regulon positive regulatory protein
MLRRPRASRRGQDRRHHDDHHGLAYQAPVEFERSFAWAAERGRQAVELAERHGRTDEPAAAMRAF